METVDKKYENGDTHSKWTKNGMGTRHSSATLETERYRLGGSVENSFRPVTGVGHLPNEPLAATVCTLPVENAERTWIAEDARGWKQDTG